MAPGLFELVILAFIGFFFVGAILTILVLVTRKQ